MDLDQPCPHETFEAYVEVNRISEIEQGPIHGFMAEIRVWCSQCNEQFRWTGAPAGMSYSRPMVSVDETCLNAPLRPALSDPDFGMGLPGFAVRYQEDPPK